MVMSTNGIMAMNDITPKIDVEALGAITDQVLTFKPKKTKRDSLKQGKVSLPLSTKQKTKGGEKNNHVRR